VGVGKAIDMLQAKFGKMNQQQQMYNLTHLFGIQGAMAARLLMVKGAQSYQEILDAGKKAADLDVLLQTKFEGFNAQMKLLSSTATTMWANIFNPWLAPLTEATKLTQKMTENVSKFAGSHQESMGILGGAAAAELGILGVYGIGHLLKGGVAGARVLRGIKGIAGVGVGVAEGKALEAATGVKPVFVTNWPSNLGGAGAAEAMLERTTLKGVLKKVATHGMGSAKLLGKAGALGATFAASYAAGTWFNDHVLDNTKAGQAVGHDIGASIAHVLAFFGNDAAQAAVNYNNAHPQPAEVSLKIGVEAEKGSKAKVKDAQSQHAQVHTSTSHDTGGGEQW
jgi:hypothetical protein